LHYRMLCCRFDVPATTMGETRFSPRGSAGTRGVASSFKLRGSRRWAVMASAEARVYNGGVGAEPPVGVRRVKPPPETDGILVMSTHFCAVLHLAVVGDLTEATRHSQAYIS